MECEQPIKKRKKYHRCPNCGLCYPTRRSMTSHLNGCVQVESAPNVAPNNYTAAEFNREITKGNINPHQFRTGLPYRMLINNPGLISQQQWQQQCPQNDIVETKIDFNADTIGGLQHIGVGEANDDEHSLFSVGQEEAPNDEDMFSVITSKMSHPFQVCTKTYLSCMKRSST